MLNKIKYRYTQWTFWISQCTRQNLLATALTFGFCKIKNSFMFNNENNAGSARTKILSYFLSICGSPPQRNLQKIGFLMNTDETEIIDCTYLLCLPHKVQLLGGWLFPLPWGTWLPELLLWSWSKHSASTSCQHSWWILQTISKMLHNVSRKYINVWWNYNPEVIKSKNKMINAGHIIFLNLVNQNNTWAKKKICFRIPDWPLPYLLKPSVLHVLSFRD